jgi:NifU-like protein involved in Fe-S cluster formation
MSSEESSLLVQEYYKNNQYNQIPEYFTISTTQGNSLCGDTITVYLVIEDHSIKEYGYDGEPAQITKAAAEFLGEFIV